MITSPVSDRELVTSINCLQLFKTPFTSSTWNLSLRFSFILESVILPLEVRLHRASRYCLTGSREVKSETYGV